MLETLHFGHLGLKSIVAIFKCIPINKHRVSFWIKGGQSKINKVNQSNILLRMGWGFIYDSPIETTKEILLKYSRELHTPYITLDTLTRTKKGVKWFTPHIFFADWKNWIFIGHLSFMDPLTIHMDGKWNFEVVSCKGHSVCHTRSYRPRTKMILCLSSVVEIKLPDRQFKITRKILIWFLMKNTLEVVYILKDSF